MADKVKDKVGDKQGHKLKLEDKAGDKGVKTKRGTKWERQIETK